MQPTISPVLPGLSAQEFVAKWSKTDLKEKSAAQEHFIDVCHLVGHPTPAEVDPTGQFFTFEAEADKQSGGHGWADAWKKDHFGWEYKGKHADLGEAYQQLLLYRESLGNPALLVVSDMDKIVIHTNFTNTVKRIEQICLEELLQSSKLDMLKAVFFDYEAFRTPQTPEQVTEEAASEFAHLADLLRNTGADSHEIAHFLIRLLFCLFAEDIGLLPKNIFTQLVLNTRKQPSVFVGQLKQLFSAMTLGGWFGINQIAHFDGRLFDDDSVLELDSESLDILAKVGALDWSNIEPSIFGTLFERSLDPAKRSQVGAHFTSREDILLITEPVLMFPLRQRWQEIKSEVQELVQQRDEAGTRLARAKCNKRIVTILRDFADEIAQVCVLDPACGSGNFLYVALKQLLDLQKEVGTLTSVIGLTPFFPSVTPTQLYGIENNEYAHELAQATIWIGYIQWLRENGFGIPSEPILKPLDTVFLMDAVLGYDENEELVEPEWPQASYIIGNPPFLGGKRLRTELGDQYVESLFALYDGRVPREADLVCYWFEKARAMIAEGKAKRVGLLATQGIRGGANRRVLERIKRTGDIFWAQSDRDWILDGATVHVSMVGFDNGDQKVRTLDRLSVNKIIANLTARIDLTQAQRLKENLGICFQGPVKVGPFDIEEPVAQAMLMGKNPHGLSNAGVVKPWMNASDITGISRSRYIIDFDELSLEEAALFEAPFEYVREKIKPLRERNRDNQRRTYWWRLGRSGSDFKEAKKGRSRIIVTPRVAKHRVFIWADVELVPDSAVVSIARDDDYFMGVLHSKVHELWARSMGTQLREAESGFRYTLTTTFETFPFPWLPSQEPDNAPQIAAIAQATCELVQKRDAWLNPKDAIENELKGRTLTNLYNQSPTWLVLAHQKLDEAVLNAYGWSLALSDEAILERLLALNLERATS